MNKNPCPKIIMYDTETTSLEGEVVQLAYCELNSLSDEVHIIETLIQPNEQISFGAMGVHHITNDMVSNEQKFNNSFVVEQFLSHNKPYNYYVAHNIYFDNEVLIREGVCINFKSIDTYQLSLHFYPYLENHKLQTIRYSLGLSQIESDLNFNDVIGEIIAHEAKSDVIILSLLFERLYLNTNHFYFNDSGSMGEILTKMLYLSTAPAKLNCIKFGKYIGESFEDIVSKDPNYCNWLLSNNDDTNIKHTIELIRARNKN